MEITGKGCNRDAFPYAETGIGSGWAIQTGVLVAGTLISAQTIRIEPPLVITFQQIDEVERLADTLAEVNKTDNHRS